MRYYVCLLIAVCCTLRMHAQDSFNGIPSTMIGVGGGAQFSWHNGAVSTSDGAYDCCSFTGGNGVGLAFGARALFAISNGIMIRGAIGFEQYNAEFTSVRLAYPVLSSTNTIEYADLDEVLDVSISTVTIETQVQYFLLNPGLYLSAGPALHLPMSPTWTHTETIAAPSDLRYVDGASAHVLLDGEIPDMSTFLSLRVGAGAIFPISGSIYANPEMLYSFALSDAQSASVWSISGFQLTIGVYAGL